MWCFLKNDISLALFKDLDKIESAKSFQLEFKMVFLWVYSTLRFQKYFYVIVFAIYDSLVKGDGTGIFLCFTDSGNQGSQRRAYLPVVLQLKSKWKDLILGLGVNLVCFLL